jgi:proteasome alpha subunit
VRPFGVSVIVGGIENGKPRVFETDPSGSFYEWRATAIGEKSAEIKERFEDDYEDDLSTGEAVALAYEAVEETNEDVTPESFEVAVVEKETEEFRNLTSDEVREYVE